MKLWRAVSRADRYRLVAFLNTLYPYKLLLYAGMFGFGLASVVNDLWWRASWDVLNLTHTSYGILSACLVLGPLVAGCAQLARNGTIAIRLSIIADTATTLAILGYSLIVYAGFGMVFTCPILWGLCAGLAVCAASDVLLLRLMATAPRIGLDPQSQAVRDQLATYRLRGFVGPHKWAALHEAVDAVELLARLDDETPTAGDGDEG